MRTPTLTLFCAAGLTVAACGCGVTRFDVHASSTTTVPGNPALPLLSVIPFGASFTNFDLSQQQDFQNQGVTKNQIDSCKLKALKLTVTSGQSLDQFLTSIKFFAETSGQPQVLVAQKTSIPANSTSLTLDVMDVELLPYVTAPSMTITTQTNGHQPAQDTTIKADATFSVDAKI